jgi:hypothetical protein
VSPGCSVLELGTETCPSPAETCARPWLVASITAEIIQKHIANMRHLAE